MKILLIALRGENYNACNQYSVLDITPCKAEEALFSIMRRKEFVISELCRGGGTEYRVSNYLVAKYQPKWTTIEATDDDEDLDLIEELEKYDSFDLVLLGEYINIEDRHLQLDIFYRYLEHLKENAKHLLTTTVDNAEDKELFSLLLKLKLADFKIS